MDRSQSKDARYAARPKSSDMGSVVDRLFEIGDGPLTDEVDRAGERREQMALSRLIKGLLDHDRPEADEAA